MDCYRFFCPRSSNLEYFECWFQKLTYWAFFPLSFGHWIWILNPIWKILSIVEVWKWLAYNLMNFKVNFKIDQIFQFRLEIHIQCPKLSGKDAPYVNFWNQHSNYSKLDDFERKKSITTRIIFWCQKLPKINLYLTLFFVF